MKTLTIGCAVIAFLFTAAAASAALHTTLPVKAGDEVYVCECGTACGCAMVSLKEATCACGHKLVKVTLSKVKGTKAQYTLQGKKQTALLAGKYVCSCESKCCQTVSQKPAKCGCGKDLIPVVMAAKAGETVYVCPCGSSCGCSMVSKKEAKCGCGHQLVKVTLNKVKGVRAQYELDGKKQTANLAGKFVCGCGPECCQAVSQKAVKCACGKDMVEVL